MPGTDGQVAKRPTVKNPSRSFLATICAKSPSAQPSRFHAPYSVS